MTPLLIALALVTQSPSGGAADDEAVFRELVDQGLEAYQAKRYDEAAETFLEAYAIIPEPELIYNAGRAYEKGLKREEAIEQYERFLTLEGTTARLRSRALESLKLLRAEIDALNAPVGVPPAAAVAPPPPGINRTLEVALLSTGGAALVAGGVFGILALRSKADFDDATGEDRQGLREDVERNALTADILIASGAAIAATGIVLFFVRKPSSARTASWTPTIGPGTVGIAGNF